MAQASSATAREPSMEEILASIRRIIEDSDGGKRPGGDLAEIGLAEAEQADETIEAEPLGLSLVDDATPQAKTVAEVEAFRSEFTAPVEDVSPQPVRAPEPSQPAFQALDGGRAHESAPVRSHEAAPVRSADTGPRSAIISETAGRQVAAAFEELSDAFTASRKRSYDEIAEEIMRPMLQEWLDNNLPLLVERLVREEIERVARGGTR
jgi:cell pole-organizing protein PopZ